MTARRLRHAAGFAAIAAVTISGALSCAPSIAGESPRVIEPPASTPAGPTGPGAPASAVEPVPIAPIDRADRLVALLAVNIDSDPDEEQVVAVQRRDDPSAPVRILVADHDAPRSRWARIAWESPTGATLARFFTLSTEDLVGDHGLTIIARGMNADGRFTLDAFRRSPLADGSDLAFRQICSIVGDDILIQELERPESYVSGQKNGLSFPILSFSRDPGSANPVDLIRVSWSWKYSDNRYVAAAIEKVPGERANQEQLEQLYADLRPEAFEEFLAGIWVEQQPPRPSSAPDVMEFRPGDRRIAISSGDTLEVFIWRDTLRTLPDRVIIVAENEVVAKSTRTISVRATGMTSLAVIVRGNNGAPASETLFARPQEAGGAAASRTVPAAPRPSGVYVGPGGLAVDFGEQLLTWSEPGRQRSASWVSFVLDGQKILSVRFNDTGEERSWVLGVSEKRDTGQTVRTLTLSPATLTVQGSNEAPGTALELRQVEETRPK